ncbi:MAG: peptide ABC transporter substrate-binding protein [Crocinitomicaceae bacterium]
MKKIAFVLVVITLFTSCSKSERQEFEYSGGSITMALEYQMATNIPRDVLDYYSAKVLNQITEGLVGFNPETLKIEPKLAKSWTKSDDGTKYTFTLRNDVYFHPHDVFSGLDDRKMTTEDVIKSFEMACTKKEDSSAPNSYSSIFKNLLKGADDFLEGKAKSISGLTVSGQNVTLELLHEDQNFLNKMTNVTVSIVSKKIIEAGIESEAVIGTGPFVYTTYKSGEQPELILLKNTDYYEVDDQGNALPYLDSVVFVFQSRKLEQLDMFEEGKLDIIVELPTSRITRMLEGRIEDFNSKPPKLILSNNPLLISHYYFFNMKDERFKDPLVRKAFNYAVDRDAIGRDIIRGQYNDLGEYGIVPPIPRALRGYDFKSIKNVGYTFDPEKAKKLLAEAGYPNGEGFGSVELRYNISDTHSAVADEFAKQIFKVLGINVNIDGSSFEQLTADRQVGNGDIFRNGWSADYASPETFLMNFYGKFVPDNDSEPSPTNESRYKNPLFDEFYEQAQNSDKLSDQMRLFSQAEVELMKNPPIIPLWYAGDIAIMQSYVRNFHFNALNHFEFKKVYIKPWTAEEYKAAHAEKN